MRSSLLVGGAGQEGRWEGSQWIPGIPPGSSQLLKPTPPGQELGATHWKMVLVSRSTKMTSLGGS